VADDEVPCNFLNKFSEKKSHFSLLFWTGASVVVFSKLDHALLELLPRFQLLGF
jgi:hypothetical protein